MSKRLIYSGIFCIVALLAILHVVIVYAPAEFTPQVVVSNNNSDAVETTSSSSTSYSPSTHQSVTFTLAAHGDVYTTSLAKGVSVYTAMTMLASTTPFTSKAKFYPGLGFFVEEIDGIKNAHGFYWTLYVNGSYSMVGASQYVIKNNDQIEWKYEKK